MATDIVPGPWFKRRVTADGRRVVEFNSIETMGRPRLLVEVRRAVWRFVVAFSDVEVICVPGVGFFECCFDDLIRSADGAIATDDESIAQGVRSVTAAELWPSEPAGVSE